MGEALLSGMLAPGWDPAARAVAEVEPERRRLVEERFGGVRVVPSPAWAVAESDVVVLAVKPSDVGAALEQALPSLKTAALLLSIAAGVTLATLEEAVPDRPVVRAMPNTAALVRKGAAAIAGGRHASAAHLDEAERILGSVGVVVRVPEELLDAVTGLSGSGPAYVFLVAGAMVEAGGVCAGPPAAGGLPRETAATRVHQPLVGAAALLVDGTEGPEALRAAVTSPGGTTASGLARLRAPRGPGRLLDGVGGP